LINLYFKSAAIAYILNVISNIYLFSTHVQILVLSRSITWSVSIHREELLVRSSLQSCHQCLRLCR